MGEHVDTNLQGDGFLQRFSEMSDMSGEHCS